ncbi:hypothetical protein EXIGLDRAFT_767796 [Exidia glandulosa HHB12029]|uniref:C2H2-type domain-containing protein n=1 Tax=Exidia glandulosa HHB12029 TaxID=1314781 RepID=A0A165IPG9_EXIGL|nr:hypothetical protein EXIGLDRAFT_767796 [Exidia glandulosa HHB12029]
MSIPPYTEQDEFFCLTCGRFSHHDEDVVRAHHRQCSDKRVWCCKACPRQFMDYREAEEHVWEHWRVIEQNKRRERAEEEEQQRLREENVRREMQDRARALLRDGAHPPAHSHSG